MQNRENDSPATVREMYWDEDNRLMVLSDNGKTSRYTYNHAGERIIKSHGDLEGVYINGAPQGIMFHENDEFTLYPASILSVNRNRFTKHYFIGNQRIASRIGTGRFNNVYGLNGSYVTAGQQDYAERMNQIETQRESYYKKMGIAPGVPTMKGAYGDPENTGVGYNTIITELGDHSVPANWAQYVIKKQPGETPGPPIIWGEPESPEEAEPGYGYIADGTTEDEETFFYHSDHLGSTSYITDKEGNVTQYTSYLPYGELLVDEHSSSEDLPYRFNGKELDEETGLYYYGARYLNPITSLFLNTDRFREKYPHLSAYSYCAGNPINAIDINGDTLNVLNRNGEYLFSLDDKQREKKNISAKKLYKEGIQWFESSADNYMPLLYVNSNIKKMKSFKHFTWDEVIEFAEVDRNMLDYRSGGAGDWKAKGKPGEGYLMVEVEGVPYWTDAIGQIPYALNEYRNVYKKTGNASAAESQTIMNGQRFGDGSLLNILFPSPDRSNNYDNAMIKRSINWAKKRYGINGQTKSITINNWPANKMRVYNIKTRNR